MISGIRSITRFFLLTVLAALLFGASVVYAESDIVASGTCGAEGNEDNVMWSLDTDGVLIISGTGAMADYNDIEGKIYTSDSPWYSRKADVKKIVVTKGVTNIGDRAFSGCYYAVSTEIPNSVKSIGTEAFCNCGTLKEINIPGSVKSIGVRAFLECRGLTDVMIQYGVTSLGGEAFEYCDSLKSVQLPESLTSIGNAAFFYCTHLTDINIPSSVTTIEHSAFYYCVRLESIVIPDGVTSLEDGVFSGCLALNSVTIPGSVTTINDWAFKNCSSLSYVEIPYGVTSIGNKAFEGCTGLTSLLIPDTVTSIGATDTFKNCSSLSNIYVVKDSYADTWLSGSELASSVKHVYREGDYHYHDVTVSLPGCETTGSKKVTRLGGGEIKKYQEEIPALGHDYKEVEGAVVAATCTKNGSRKYICSRCEDEKTETVPATGHTEEVTSSKEPTCTETGEKTYKCTVCGNTRTETIPATGHDWGEWTVTTEATCGTKGIETRTCKTDPSHTETRDIAATGRHIWNEGEVTKEPTCTKTGVRKYTCTVCGNTRTETIPATGHDWGEWTVTTEPTCGAKGVETRTCKTDPSHTENRYISATGKHTWNEGEVTREATCEKDGVRKYTCTVCGNTRTEAIPATGHDWNEWTVTTEPTCGAKGVETRVCKHDDAHVETREIAATGKHTWDEGEITTAPTCTEPGAKTFTCTVCGATRTEEVTSIQHDWGEWTVTTEPTCVDKGVETRFCKNDPSHFETRDIAPGDNHTWDEGEITKAPTCTEPGEKTYTCTACGATRTEEVEASGHDWGDWTVTTEPTCVDKGVETRVCKNDQSHTETREVAETGIHSYKDTVVDPTYDEGGYTLHECTVCGHSYKEYTSGPLEPTVLDGGKCGANAKWQMLSSGTLRIFGSGAMTDFYYDSAILFNPSTDIPWYDYRNSIKRIIVEKGITSIGDNAFRYTSVTEVILSDSVESIGEDAFFSCKELSAISMPGVRTIGASAFYYDEGLTSVDLPEGLTGIGRSAFSHCNKLTEINIPSTVNSIGGRAFEMCSKLTGKDGRLSLPEGLAEIAGDTFSGCIKMTAIYVPASVTEIGSYAFDNCPGLAYVYYGGNTPQLNKININSLGNSYFKKAEIVVSKKYDLAGAELSLERYSYDYTGSAITPLLDVICDGYSAVEGKDYTVEYADNTEMGTATIRITGKGNFEGTNSIEFGIYESTTSIEDCEIALANTSVEYTGNAIEETVTVSYNGKALEAGKDYRVKYVNNVDPGTAKATVEGIGTFYGKVTREFTIVKVNYDISLDTTRTIMCAGTPMQLKATSEVSVMWKSSNNAVATVSSNGTVRALSPGTATITAYNKKKSASCQITVKDYSYLAGTDSRVIQNRYSNSRINKAAAYAFTDALGSDIVITYVHYTIINNYSQFRLHNLTNGTTAEEATSYYDNIVNRSFGAQKVLAMDARIQAQQAKVKLLNGEGRSYNIGAIQPSVNSIYNVGGSQYQVLSTSSRTVKLIKAKNVKTFTVSATVKLSDGRSYNVTQIGAKAFKGTKTTKIVLKTKLLKKAGVKQCLKGSKVKTVKVSAGSKKVNAKLVKSYKKIFTKKNAGKAVKVS